MSAIDWRDLPLGGDGRSLVEASAGTGKTWTIAALYLRLLLECGRTPRHVVVSTFTNAAAAELSERLRAKLTWAVAEATRAGETGCSSVATEDESADLAWLRDRWRKHGVDPVRDARRLQAALSEFDGAPISTLHKLCSRILTDHPFAAGVPLRGRELVDGKQLGESVATDLWRVICQGDESDELVKLARLAGIQRKHVDRYVPVLLQPGVVARAFDNSVLRNRLSFVGDLGAWATEARGLLEDDALFNQNCVLRRVWRSLIDLVDFHPGAWSGELDIDRLANSNELSNISKAGKAHPGIQSLARTCASVATMLSVEEWDRLDQPDRRNFLAAAQHWCRATLQARLDAAEQTTFDQLLVVVRDALTSGHRALADALFEAWPVALVDEFQDTDPVQFDILDAIYRDASGKPRGRLVMIGDPKQAIYRFRGGDIQAYERAKAGVAEADRLTLGTNFRSSRAYVEAVNAFYGATGRTLGPPGSGTSIEYEDVASGGRRDGAPLCAANGEPVGQPLVLHVLEPTADPGGLETAALRACAGRIVQALSPDGYVIRDGDRPRPLEPGDIAVLLPGHAQITALAHMLKSRGVPCVALSDASVFASATARELQLVLHAALHPDDPRVLRAALATRLLGGSLASLHALRHDHGRWDREARAFHGWHQRLEARGPQSLVDALMDAHAARLLQALEGERILTDLRHLGELLQEAWDACGTGERLSAWFARQVHGSGDGDGESVDIRSLRLESDDGRVRLMTLHASKGLEFPVVFLPLMWKHGRRGGGEARTLADPESRCKHIVLGAARGLVERQQDEERYRVLYVALTRAIHACHLFLLPRGEDLSRPISEARRKIDSPLNAIDGPLLSSEPPAHLAREDGWPAMESLRHARVMSEAVPMVRPLPRSPQGPLPMRHSFSTLSGRGPRRMVDEDGAAEDEVLAGQAVGAEEPTDAPAPPAGTTRDDALDALSDVAGTDFGNAVHAIFEHREPGVSLHAQQALVAGALADHGVRPRGGDSDSLVAPLTDRLQAVLEAPLGGPGGPRLISLRSGDMRAELEFNYALDDVSLQALRAACERHGEPALVPDREQALAGLMNGKIDLVFAHGGRFHVLDYKGNRLGDTPSFLEDYAPAALEPKMRDTGYRFQALLYTVAVERYLDERLGTAYRRAAHLGDAWYLFIRAVGLQLPDGTPCGVWRHRFSDALLDAVQVVLGRPAMEAAA